MERAQEILNEMYRILTPSVSGMMGLVTVIIMLTVLIFNHYSWRRAFVLSTISLLGIAGWYIVKLSVLGPVANRGISLTETAITFLLVLFVIVGYVAAGVISSLQPLPIIKLRLLLRRGILSLANGVGVLRVWFSEQSDNFSETLHRLSDTLYKAKSLETLLVRFAEKIPEKYERDPDRVIEQDIHPLIMELVNDKKDKSFAMPADLPDGLYPDLSTVGGTKSKGPG